MTVVAVIVPLNEAVTSTQPASLLDIIRVFKQPSQRGCTPDQPYIHFMSMVFLPVQISTVQPQPDSVERIIVDLAAHFKATILKWTRRSLMMLSISNLKSPRSSNSYSTQVFFEQAFHILSGTSKMLQLKNIEIEKLVTWYTISILNRQRWY